MTTSNIEELETLLPEQLLARRVVHAVNLAAIKLSSGALWEKVSAGVILRLESILKRTLTPADFYAQADDTHFVIATPALEPVDAAITTLHIAYELTVGILGHCDVELLRIERVASCAGGKLTTIAFSPEEISRLVDKAQLSDVGGVAVHRRATQESSKKKNLPAVERAGLDIEHLFEPLWDSKNEAITTYLCAASSIREKGAETAISFLDLTLKERSQVEQSCVMTGIGFLSEFVERGDRFVLGLPVDFETLCAPVGRMEFVRLCRGLPAAYRPYLLFFLMGVPLGVTHSRLSDLASLIKPFGRAAASVASGCRNFNAYQGHGFCALVLDTASACNAQIVTRDIVHLAAAASNSRMGSIVLGLADDELVNQACAADIQMLQGPAVAPSVVKPRRMTRLPRAKVLRLGEVVSEEWF